MKESYLENTQTAALRKQLSQEKGRLQKRYDRLRARALYNDRTFLIAASWVVAACALALMLTALGLRDFTPAQKVVLWAIVGGNVCIAGLMSLLGPAGVYRTILIGTCMNMFACTGQLFAFYFGREFHQILGGLSPVLMVAIPFLVIWTRSVLKPQHAKLINLTFLVVLALLVTIHAAIYWAEAETLYAMALMMVTVYLIGPMCEALMALNSRVYLANAHAVLEDLLLTRGQRNPLAGKFVDENSGALNRDGVLIGLDAALARNSRTEAARFEITNVESLRREHGENVLNTLVPLLCQHFRKQFPEGYRIGVARENEIFVWGVATFTDWKHQVRQITRIATDQMSEQGYVVRFALGAIIAPLNSGSGLALEELNFACLMNRLGK